MQTQSRPHWLVLTISLVFLLSITIRTIRHLLHYPSSGDPSEVAEWIVEQNLNPSVCFKMSSGYIPFLPVNLFPAMGPTPASKRSLCVYKVAEIKQDPNVCSLLLPSEYGLACISNLWPQMLPDDGCGWDISNPKIYQCRHTGGPLRKSASCTDFSDNEKQFSACLFYMADREKNIEKCEEIPDQAIRTFCQVRLGAWMKYPQLRGSFYFGKQ